MSVTPPRPARPRPLAPLPAFALALLCLWSLDRGIARAEVTTLDATRAPIVRINVRAGDVTVRTWDRESVAVEGDPGLSILRRATNQPVEQTSILIPQFGAKGGDGANALPAESFVVSSIPAGPREAVVIRSAADASGPLIVTVPNDSVFVFVSARGGNLDVHDYRGGTFVGFTTRGRLDLDGVGGAVFAQTGRGALTMRESDVDRVRARSLAGNMTFERCRSRQIEATSVGGSIVYDAGTFDPGLARFESTRGDIAIGTQAPAQLAAHAAGDGRIFTNFERPARVDDRGGEANAIVGGGGPVVTATTQSGNVYLYDGTLRTRDRLAAPWHAPLGVLGGSPVIERAAPAPRRLDVFRPQTFPPPHRPPARPLAAHPVVRRPLAHSAPR